MGYKKLAEKFEKTNKKQIRGRVKLHLQENREVPARQKLLD